MGWQALGCRRWGKASVGRWLKALGLSGERAPQAGRVPGSQRAARLRETMRWRGFDLSAYSDAEIATAAELLGPSITPEGETTDESRAALADLLLQRRIDPDAKPAVAPEPEPETPTTAPDPQPAASVPEPGVMATAEAAEPEAMATAPARRPRRPGEIPTTLERLKHVFGIHTWHFVDAADGDGQVLRCYGCRAERSLAAIARPLQFPDSQESEGNVGEAPREPLATGDRVRRPDFHESQSRRPANESDNSPEPGAGQAFRLLVRSPWWVKLVAFFVIIQVAGLVVRLLAGAG